MNITKPKNRSIKIIEKNIINQLTLFDYNYFETNKKTINRQRISMTKNQALTIEKKLIKTFTKNDPKPELASIEKLKQNLENNPNQISFIDLFAGIGGIKIGLENAGFKSVFSNDFDKYCKRNLNL